MGMAHKFEHCYTLGWITDRLREQPALERDLEREFASCSVGHFCLVLACHYVSISTCFIVLLHTYMMFTRTGYVCELCLPVREKVQVVESKHGTLKPFFFS
jgi:hypothetical protein